jgi:hypothetical protein
MLCVVLIEVFRDVAALGVTHMDVQYRSACIEAIHRGLDLFVPGDREFLFRSAVPWHPNRPTGRCQLVEMAVFSAILNELLWQQSGFREISP